MSARVPDVTVVVAVYNTMPYLRQCLASVLGQSLGADRIQLVAVNDGSTDSSPAELEKWAAKHPRTVTVLHQENSGGPASPSNRALDVATGRYVFFLGADDHLGREALERLVRVADDLEADVVLGRMVGTGGRVVNQSIYRTGDRDDVDLVNSSLPWALSNTKLFRRSLIEEHGIRYPEELRSYSDQPFTLRAVLAARRVAVRADYDYYFATRRTDSSNITYGTPLPEMLQNAAIIMDTAADLITDPAARHVVLRRHFTWELGKLLSGPRYLDATPEEQQVVVEGVRKLAEAYLTEEMRTSLDVQRRVPISMAQFGTAADVAEVARHHQEHGLTPVVVEGERTYVTYPGFRAADGRFPDEWFDVTEQRRMLDHQDGPARVGIGTTSDGRRALTVAWRSNLVFATLPADARPRVLAGEHGVTAVVGDEISAALPLDELVAGVRRRRRSLVRFVVPTGGDTVGWTVKAESVGAARRVVHRSGLGLFLISAALDQKGRLAVVVLPLTPRQFAGRLKHRLLSARNS